jgi:hypothetical protein
MMTRGRKIAVIGLIATLLLSGICWSFPSDYRSLLASYRASIALGPCLALASAGGMIAAFSFLGSMVAFGILAVSIDAAKRWHRFAGCGLFAAFWLILGILGVAPYV